MSSPQASQFLSHTKAMEDDILGELKFILEKILRGMIDMDGGHSWKRPHWRKTKLLSSMKISM
jgi:hypothetical protein